MTKEIDWKKYPNIKPSGDYKIKSYLVKTKERSSITDDVRTVFRICHWVNFDDLHGWYYRGNEFIIDDSILEFEWLNPEDLI